MVEGGQSRFRDARRSLALPTACSRSEVLLDFDLIQWRFSEQPFRFIFAVCKPCLVLAITLDTDKPFRGSASLTLVYISFLSSNSGHSKLNTVPVTTGCKLLI
jgi:hypothetical protein